MSTNEDRKRDLHIRLEQLDALLAQHIAPHSADDPRIVGLDEMQYFSDRREEREFILKELEKLNKTA